jgi:predicted MFS family arabinose efflux permease
VRAAARTARPKFVLIWGDCGKVGPVLVPRWLGPLRTGPLTARRFVLLACGQTISTLGSAMAPIALAFAVLKLTHSAGDLGIVLAARSVAVVLFLLLGGAVSDRLPRHVVLVGSSLIAGLSQSAAAALLFTGSAHVAALAALQVVNGASSAFTLPAASALIPQTVPADKLRQANAVVRMGSNGARIIGAALGGVVVAGFGPGWGIAADAGSFFAAAAMLTAVRVTAAAAAKDSMARQLAAGWREFWARTWLWVVVVQFAFINMAVGGAYNVLGPLVASQRLGGAGAWGIIVAADSVGLITGGLIAARRHDKRPLLAGNLALFLQLPQLALLAMAAPVPVIAAASVLAGLGVEIFAVRWITTMHEQIAADMQSRMFAYDALGSFLFIPIGQTLAGPAQRAFGTSGAIWAGTATIGVAVLAVCLVPQVRSLRARSTAQATINRPSDGDQQAVADVPAGSVLDPGNVDVLSRDSDTAAHCRPRKAAERSLDANQRIGIREGVRRRG